MGLMRNLGAFVGHIARAIKPDAHPLSHAGQAPTGVTQPPHASQDAITGTTLTRVMEQEVRTPEGAYLARRTVVDEALPLPDITP